MHHRRTRPSVCRCKSSRSSRTSGRRAFVQAHRLRCLARRCMFVRVCRTRAALLVPFNRRVTVVCVATRCNTFQHVVLHEKRVQDSAPAVPLPRSLGRQPRCPPALVEGGRPVPLGAAVLTLHGLHAHACTMRPGMMPRVGAVPCRAVQCSAVQCGAGNLRIHQRTCAAQRPRTHSRVRACVRWA